MSEAKKHKRANGIHYTPKEIFRKYIYPQIEDKIWDYCWVDFYCGEGNLILPILETIDKAKRIDFFKEHIYMFDIDTNAVDTCIKKAIDLGIPEKLAQDHIKVTDTLSQQPKIDSKYQLFHITNPPYLYLGYISKHQETKKHLGYFQDENNGLQDLYQIALANDLRKNIKNMVYIIPSNFLFGDSISNNIRNLIYPHYNLNSAIIFEKQIFAETGTNVMIGFFERKNSISKIPQDIKTTKINSKIVSKILSVSPKNNWRAGSFFVEYLEKLKHHDNKISFYLLMKDLKDNPGEAPIALIDSSKYEGSQYKKLIVKTSEDFSQKIKTSNLWLRTVDTGSQDGKAGIYDIHISFGVDGIVVGNDFTYRTSPMQIFFEPAISKSKQKFVKIWVNGLLSYLREKTDGEFMTTYKYSQSKYTRKYLGLKQAKALIKSCPLHVDENMLKELEEKIEKGNYFKFFDNQKEVLELYNDNQLKRRLLAEQTSLNSF